MTFDELCETGSIRPVGVICLNDDWRVIYAHDGSGDLFAYFEDEDIGQLVEECPCNSSMKTMSSYDSVLEHVQQNMCDGVIGAIEYDDGTFLDFLTDEDGNPTYRLPNSDSEYATSFMLEVVMEDYD